MDYNEITALIRLLDDSDSEIFTQIEQRLLHYGKPVIPFLEKAWGGSLDALMQQRIENIIHRIQFEDLQRELRVWVETGAQDLIKATVMVARYQYPELKEADIRSQLEKIRKDVWLEVNDGLTALEQIRVLNRVFFEIHGFSGNTQHYHAPQNSFINIALESRKGNPLMLSILYQEVAQGAGIPVYGVNLPEHFILCYKEDADPGSGSAGQVLFYVNPFSKGDVFHRKEIDLFLQQLKIMPDRSFYEPCTNLDMIQRLIRNLMNSYHKLGFMDKVQELEQLMKATDLKS